jgi:hypothetical protein
MKRAASEDDLKAAARRHKKMNILLWGSYDSPWSICKCCDQRQSVSIHGGRKKSEQ